MTRNSELPRASTDSHYRPSRTIFDAKAPPNWTPSTVLLDNSDRQVPDRNDIQQNAVRSGMPHGTGAERSHRGKSSGRPCVVRSDSRLRIGRAAAALPSRIGVRLRMAYLGVAVSVPNQEAGREGPRIIKAKAVSALGVDSTDSCRRRPGGVLRRVGSGDVLS